MYDEEIKAAYEAGFNQTADLRFHQRSVALDEHTGRLVNVLQQRFTRGYWDAQNQKHVIEDEIWIDVPVYREGTGK